MATRPRNPVPRGRPGFPPSPSAGDTFVHPDTGLAYRYSGRRHIWYRTPASDRGAPPAESAVLDEPSTAVSDLKPDAGPRVLQLFDERPHPALPDGVLARYPISDLSDDALGLIIERVTAAVLAGLPAALARARMQP